jgi:hypothetical protein
MGNAYGPEAQLTIQALDCVLTLEDVYDKVEFEADDLGISREILPEEHS